MKLLNTLILSILVLTVTIFAQVPDPPPPAPYIYSIPEKSLIKTYKSVDFDFQCDFPGTPDMKLTSNLNLKEINFKTNLGGSDENVSVFDYNFDVEKEISKRKIFEYIMSKYLVHPDNELSFSKDIEFNGLTGKEFGILEDYNYRIVRVFTIKNRIYELNVYVTNWHILNDYHKQIVKEFEKESQRFFESCNFNHSSIDAKYQQHSKTTSPVKKELFNNVQAIEFYSRKKNTFTSKSGRFESYFNYKPTKSIDEIETVFGKVNYYSYIHRYGKGFYGVSYFDYLSVDQEDDKKLLFAETQKNQLLIIPNAKLLKENKLNLNGIFVNEFIFEADGNKFTMRIYFDEKRVFRLIFTQNYNDEQSRRNFQRLNDEWREKFFSSFKIIKSQ